MCLNFEAFYLFDDFRPKYNPETQIYEVEFSTNKMLTTEVGASARLLYNLTFV